MNEQIKVADRRLGRLPSKASRKALMAGDFLSYFELPASTVEFWTERKPFPIRTFGNTQYGCCTRASQAHMILRMERLEQRRTVDITDAEVIARYKEMIRRRYGSEADNGAYETDALDDWRSVEHTIRDTSGHPYTIDAYLRLNAFDHKELKAGIALSGAKGIKVCLNLPAAWQRIDPPDVWDVPKNQPLIGPWQPGSWGGHSVMMHMYDEIGPWTPDQWGMPDRHMTWEAAAAGMVDEAHMVIDSIDAWRKRAEAQKPIAELNLARVIEAVNDVSSIKIAAA